MKMSEDDRLMAIARCPTYIEEFRKILFLYDKINETNPEKIEALFDNLCKKWKLKSPIPPNLGKDKELFFKANRREEAIVELTENEWPRNALLVMYQTLKRIRHQAYGEYQYVRLRIDITKTVKELEKAFSKKISSWKKDLPKQRITDPHLGHQQIWDIWDRVTAEGIGKKAETLTKLAKEEEKEICNKPWDNNNFKARRRQYERAYKKACSWIIKVTPV